MSLVLQDELLISPKTKEQVIQNTADIKAIEEKIKTGVYKFKGTVEKYSDLPKENVEIGDVYDVKSADKKHGILAGDNVCWDGEDWDNLGSYIDLSPYALQADLELEKNTRVTADNGIITDLNKEIQDRTNADSNILESLDTVNTNLTNNITTVSDNLTTESTTRQTNDTKIINNIWSNSTMSGGYFKTKNTQADTSYGQLWNENSGGGIQYYNKPENILSFVGVNKSSASDMVDVQIYAKDKTSNIGTRVNVSATEGMYYLKNCKNLGFPEEREVAVKEDLPDMSKYLTAAQIKSGYASKWDAIQTAMDFTNACWGGLTDKFWSTSSQDAGVGYFITKKIESDKSYSMLSNNTQVVLQNSNKTTGNVATVIVNSDGAYYTKNTENTTYTSNDELITRKEYNKLLLRIEALENNAS